MNTDLFQNLCRPADEESLVRATIDGMIGGHAEAHRALLTVPLEAFTSRRAREVWEAAIRLYHKGEVPNIPSLERELWSMNKHHPEHELEHWLDMGLDGDIDSLSGLVLSLHQRRGLFKIFNRASQESLNLILDHKETTQCTALETLALISGDEEHGINAWEVIEEKLADNLKFRESQEAVAKLVWFGLDVLDGDPEDGGIPAAPGHVVIVAARPGLGKTALCTQLVAASALHGERVFMVSLELSRDEMLQRLAGWFTETSRRIFDQGTYTEYHETRLRFQKESLGRIHVWDPAGPTWSRIEAKIRGAALKGFRVVAIDHFSEIDIRGMVPKGGQRREGAMECARRMKILAKELRICIVLISQLNREVAPGEIPGTEHLRETGELEQIAYSILMLYYVHVADPADSRKARGPDAPPPVPRNSLRMALVKNRDGKAGYSRALEFNGGSCRMVAHDR